MPTSLTRTRRRALSFSYYPTRNPIRSLKPSLPQAPRITMVVRHRRRPARCGQLLRDSRRTYPHRAGLSQRSLRRRCSRERRRLVRSGSIQVLDFRRLQQVPAAPVVDRTQHREPRARRRSQERRLEAGGATFGTGAPLPSRRFAANATGARRPQKRPPAPATSRSCAGPSIATFLSLPSPVSPPPWIWRNLSVQSMPVDFCARVSPHSRFWESTPQKLRRPSMLR